MLNSNICSTCVHNMVKFGPLTAEIGWRVLGTPANFNGFRVFASLLHRRRSTEANQTLHGVWPSSGLWAGTLYTFSGGGFLPPNRIVYVQDSVTARHSSSGHQPNFAAWYKELIYGTFAPRYFRSQERKPPNGISLAVKFNANGKK